MNIFKAAWKNAEIGVERFGGAKADYFIEGLRLAKEGVFLWADSIESHVEESKALVNEVINSLLLIGLFVVVICGVFSVAGHSLVIAPIFYGATLLTCGVLSFILSVQEYVSKRV